MKTGMNALTSLKSQVCRIWGQSHRQMKLDNVRGLPSSLELSESSLLRKFKTPHNG